MSSQPNKKDATPFLLPRGEGQDEGALFLPAGSSTRLRRFLIWRIFLPNLFAMAVVIRVLKAGFPPAALYCYYLSVIFLLWFLYNLWLVRHYMKERRFSGEQRQALSAIMFAVPGLLLAPTAIGAVGFLMMGVVL